MLVFRVEVLVSVYTHSSKAEPRLRSLKTFTRHAPRCVTRVLSECKNGSDGISQLIYEQSQQASSLATLCNLGLLLSLAL